MLDFRILGPFEVWAADQPVCLGGAKPRRVLASLVLEAGRIVPVARLVDAVWEDEPPDTARRQIQNAVSALRQTPLSSVLIRQGPGYLLRATPEQIDARRFEVYLSRAGVARAARDLVGAADALRAGLALWRGPALGGVGGRVAAAAEVHLGERRLTAVTEWADVALDLGWHASVVDELGPLVDAYPLREPLAGRLILALFRCGRGAEALVLYQRVREALTESLGIDPGQELQRLYRQLLTGDPALAGRPPTAAGRNDLPRDVAHFTGRVEELDRLMSMVDGGGTVVVQAIDGMAGIGKTALAVHAAHRLAGRFPDGQLFVDLHGHTPEREPLTSESALDVLLRAIGVPDESIPKNLDEKAARWRAELAGRRMLVVLDNTLTAAQIGPLLPSSPRCAVLVTSRRRMVGLAGIEVLSLDLLPEPDAVELFGRIVGPDRVGAADAAQVVRIVRLCGHLPLAIGLVAARLRARPTWTVEHLARRLADEPGRPALLEADGYGVNAAFTLSYEHLPPDQQRLFRLLGLHPGADLDGYCAAALAGLPLVEAERLLEALCDLHLLDQHTPGRYRLHNLVRGFVRIIADSEESEADRVDAGNRLLDYYLYVSEAAADLVAPHRRRIGPRPKPPPTGVPMLADLAHARTWFRAEHANLLTVARLAPAYSSGDHGWRIPRNVATYLWRYSYFAQGIDVLRIALTAIGPGSDPAARTACLMNLALMHLASGQYQPALRRIKESAASAHRTGDRLGEASSMLYMANVKIQMGAFAQALALAVHGRATFRELGDPGREGIALSIMLDALVRLGRPAEAIEAARQATLPRDVVGGERLQGGVLSRLGTAHSEVGDHDRAIELLERCARLAAEAEDRTSQAAYLCRLAQALRRAGRHAEALDRGLAALEVMPHGTDPADQSEIHQVLGAVHLDLRRYDESLAHFQRALDVAGSIGYRVGESQARQGIADASDALSDPTAPAGTLTLSGRRDSNPPLLDPGGPVACSRIAESSSATPADAHPTARPDA